LGKAALLPLPGGDICVKRIGRFLCGIKKGRMAKDGLMEDNSRRSATPDHVLPTQGIYLFQDPITSRRQNFLFGLPMLMENEVFKRTV